jgi:hypothetical protein
MKPKKNSTPKTSNSFPRTVDRIGKIRLEDAFSYFLEPQGVDSEDFHMEQGIRAVSFLLQWQSDIGNRTIDGRIANGLGVILDNVAAILAVRCKRSFVQLRAELAAELARDDVRRESQPTRPN